MRPLFPLSSLRSRRPDEFDRAASWTEAGSIAGLRPETGKRVWIRIPAIPSGQADPDLGAALAARPAGLWLAGCVGAADLQRLGARLAVAEAEADLPDGSLRVLAGAGDTAAGVLALDRLAGASPRLAGLVWDEAALAAALGPDAEAGVLDHARARTILAAAACGVPVYRPVDSAGALVHEA